MLNHVDRSEHKNLVLQSLEGDSLLALKTAFPGVDWQGRG